MRRKVEGEDESKERRNSGIKSKGRPALKDTPIRCRRARVLLFINSIRSAVTQPAVGTSGCRSDSGSCRAGLASTAWHTTPVLIVVELLDDERSLRTAGQEEARRTGRALRRLLGTGVYEHHTGLRSTARVPAQHSITRPAAVRIGAEAPV